MRPDDMPAFIQVTTGDKSRPFVQLIATRTILKVMEQPMLPTLEEFLRNAAVGATTFQLGGARYTATHTPRAVYVRNTPEGPDGQLRPLGWEQAIAGEEYAKAKADYCESQKAEWTAKWEDTVGVIRSQIVLSDSAVPLMVHETVEEIAGKLRVNCRPLQ